MTPEEIRQLFDYNAWANERSLQATAQLSDEQFVKPLGSSFSSVRDTLVHICSGEWVWLERCCGHTPSAFPDLSSIQTDAYIVGEHLIWGATARIIELLLERLQESASDSGEPFRLA